MFKKFRCLLLIVVLVMSFTMQLGTEAEAALPTIVKFYVRYGSICSDALLKKLSNVSKDPTVLEFSIFNLDVAYENDNPAGNSPSAEGVAHIGDSIVVNHTITSDEVEHNGTAEIFDLCITDSALQAGILSAILPNPNWENIWWELLGFDARFVLSTENIGEAHIIEAACDPPTSGSEWNCVVTYDSQAK